MKIYLSVLLYLYLSIKKCENQIVRVYNSDAKYCPKIIKIYKYQI